MPTATKHSIQADFAAWADETADLLQQRRFGELDLSDLVEEVRGLARGEFGAAQSQLRRLFVHLLKWQNQPRKRSKSWRISTINARFEIGKELKLSPSLRAKLTTEVITDVWRAACERVAVETGLPEGNFPEACPWDLDTQVLNPNWLP